MDGNDFYDWFVAPLEEMHNLDIGTLADHVLPPEWYLANGGRDETIERVAEAIHDEYFNTGAADEWGPATFLTWFVEGVLNRPKRPHYKEWAVPGAIIH